MQAALLQLQLDCLLGLYWTGLTLDMQGQGQGQGLTSLDALALNLAAV